MKKSRWEPFWFFSHSLTDSFFIFIILFFVSVEYGCYKPVLLWYLFYSTFNSSFNSFFYHHKYVKFFSLCVIIIQPFFFYLTRPKMTKIFILFYFIQKSFLFLFALALRLKHNTQRATNRNSLMCEICFYIYAALISQQQI